MEFSIMVLENYYLNVTAKTCFSNICAKNQKLKELRGIKVAPETLQNFDFPLHSLKPSKEKKLEYGLNKY